MIDRDIVEKETRERSENKGTERQKKRQESSKGRISR